MIKGKKTVALCVSKINERTVGDFIDAFSQSLADVDIKLLVYATCLDLYWGNDNEKGEATIFNLMDFEIIDVVVISYIQIKNRDVIDRIIEKSRANNVPVVIVDGRIDGCINVFFDYESGVEKVVKHVIEEHGVSTLHFFSGFKNHELSDKRIEAFKHVLLEKGMEFSDDMVSYGEFWAGPTESAVQSMVDSGKIPQAIVCANDTMAITVCNVLRRNGYTVPEDVIVTGFDGIEDIYFSTPQITSCECNYTDMGQRVSEIIPDVINRKITEGDFSIEPRLVILESCGCPNFESKDVTEYLMDYHNRFFLLQDNEHIFADLPARVQIADTIEQASEAFNEGRINNVACFLTKQTVDEKINPMDWDGDSTFGDEVVLLFDSDLKCPENERYIPRNFAVKDIVPRLDIKLRDSHPLIFLALSILKASIGYVCFHAYDISIRNYIQIPQFIASINISLNGFRNMRYQKYLLASLNKMYSTDQLTGLYNRRAFSMEYERLIMRMPKEGRLIVALADLDGLKEINDKYGHTEGDNAICVEARALRDAFPDSALFVRFGGDEMAAVICGDADISLIREKFLEFFDDYNRTSGRPYKVSASIGIYTVSEGENLEFEQLFKKADKLMYEEKSKRNSGIRRFPQ